METTNETMQPEPAAPVIEITETPQEIDETPPPAAKPKRKRAAKRKPAGESKPAAPKRKRSTKKPTSAKGSTSTKATSTKAAKPSMTKLPSKGATLEDVAAAYLAQLEVDGASTSTQSGYRAELGRALKVLGGNTLMSDLTEDAVRKFMRSKHVTVKRDGAKRDQKTIDRTRRVLRLALVFAQERGIVESAPVPEKI